MNEVKYKELGNTSARLLVDLEQVLEINRDKLKRFVIGFIKGNLVYFYTTNHRPLTNRSSWNVDAQEIIELPYPKPIYHHSEESRDCIWEIIK